MTSTNWECPICYNEIGKIDISKPFICDHLTCYQCFFKQIKFSRKDNKSPLKLTCCLCRSDIKNTWKTTKRLDVKEYRDNKNNKLWKFYTPLTDKNCLSK